MDNKRSLKEELSMDFENYVIEYQGKKLLVIKDFIHKNDRYLYTLNTEKIPELEINFLKKLSNGKYENVTDKNLFDLLLATVGQLAVESELEKNKKDNI